MDLTDHLATARSGAPATPVLRTVLLCDIVDSTAMVERLGDQRVAALMKRHDALLRQLVVFCHGQLIDRADGVLAVFERPIQALDFALRYQRGLHDLGVEEGLDLKARAGLHVGDVVMWANEPRDVLGGAKAFEVEGLAKPVAARLMGLALPGQILMSGMAQNLCQRAVGELGDAAPKLRWLMHGRYRFKGVPAPMLVHEVGQPGVSPLRAPESNAKAWRSYSSVTRSSAMGLNVAHHGICYRPVGRRHVSCQRAVMHGALVVPTSGDPTPAPSGTCASWPTEESKRQATGPKDGRRSVSRMCKGNCGTRPKPSSHLTPGV